MPNYLISSSSYDRTKYFLVVYCCWSHPTTLLLRLLLAIVLLSQPYPLPVYCPMSAVICTLRLTSVVLAELHVRCAVVVVLHCTVLHTLRIRSFHSSLLARSRRFDSFIFALKKHTRSKTNVVCNSLPTRNMSILACSLHEISHW